MPPIFHQKRKFSLHLYWFVFAVGLLHLLIYQNRLFGYVLGEVDLSTLHGLVTLASVQIVQLSLMAIFLLLVSLLSIPVLKIVCVAIFLTNAVAVYFLDAYNFAFSRAMIGNILNTDWREVGELWNPEILIYFALYGLLPAFAAVKVQVHAPRWYWRLSAPVAVLTLLVGWAYATSFTWLWYDRHISRIGSVVLPWSYIVNTQRYFRQVAFHSRETVLLPEARFRVANPDQKEIVVLVIGEASRADNYSHYGYSRPTNAFTEKLDLLVFPFGQACATNTIDALACIVTHEGRRAEGNTSFEPIQSYLTRHGVETLVRRNNSGMPPVKVTHTENASEIAARCGLPECTEGNKDFALVWNLANVLRESNASRLFVTLHLNGSHGPAYATRYPARLAHFTPVCETVDITACSKETLYNAYDNSIRYTDFLLAELIGQLQSLDDTRIAMIYVSDHGQSLGEYDLYLHGAPLAIAPDVQRNVPFLVWINRAFEQGLGIDKSALVSETTYPHDFPFHSIMGAFGMESAVYKPEYDIFNPDNP